jgi:hypothetical protein
LVTQNSDSAVYIPFRFGNSGACRNVGIFARQRLSDRKKSLSAFDKTAS